MQSELITLSQYTGTTSDVLAMSCLSQSVSIALTPTSATTTTMMLESSVLVSCVYIMFNYSALYLHVCMARVYATFTVLCVCG